MTHLNEPVYAFGVVSANEAKSLASRVYTNDGTAANVRTRHVSRFACDISRFAHGRSHTDVELDQEPDIAGKSHGLPFLIGARRRIAASEARPNLAMHGNGTKDELRE